MAEITIDELIAEYERLTENNANANEGMTAKEMRLADKWSEVNTRRFIRLGLDAGVIARGRRMVEDISGVRRPVPVYIFRPKKPTKQRRAEQRDGS